MKKLDFMIVGAQKCGTSALSHFLSQHPDIAIARGKEVHLFDDPDYSPLWSEAEMDHYYDDYFEDDAVQAICGEATPIYLYWPEIAQELARYNKQLKLIVMLRDPVERAISQYGMERRRGLESLPRWLAFLIEPIRLKISGEARALNSSRRTHSYIDRGFYARQIESLRCHFPDDQILLIEQSQLLQNHESTMTQVFGFLGCGDDSMPVAEQVFAGDAFHKRGFFVKTLLSLRYWRANRQLKKLLNKMGCASDWRWL